MQYGGSNVQAFRTYRNTLINGDMFVAQNGAAIQGQGSSAINMAIANSPAWSNTDNFSVSFVPGMTAVFNDIQQTIHPILNPINTGKLNAFSKELNITAAQAIINAGEFCAISGCIEGPIYSAVYGQQCVLSFWASSPIAGNHYVSFYNPNINQSYVARYVVNQANIWQQFFVPVLLNHSIFGSSFLPNVTGLSINFAIASGLNYQTNNLNQWTAGQFLSGSDQPNLLGANGNSFLITDVQLETGFVATPFDRIPFPESLSRAQRYFFSSFPYGIKPIQNAGFRTGPSYYAKTAGISNDGVFVQFPVIMSDAGTVTFYNPNAANANWRNITLGANSGVATAVISSQSSNGLLIQNPQVIGDAIGNQICVNLTVDTRLGSGF